MGWEDRQYYRDRSRSPGNIFLSIFNGSVPLFTAFGVRVRVHATLIALTLGTILFDFTKGYPLHDRIVSMAMLWVIIILHEFGHCFAARSVGGTADDVLLWPLGGLAMTSPPHRPWPIFVTAVWGPLVNVLICALCAITILLLGGGMVTLNPLNNFLPDRIAHFHTNGHVAAYQVGYYVFWMFRMSYILLLFNLLPMFPMDAGQILQTALWPKLGYYRATHIACVTGMAVAVPVAIFGIFDHLNILIICVAVAAFLVCRNRLIMLKETGGEENDSGSGTVDFSSSLRPDAPTRKRRRPNRWAIRRLRRQAKRDAAEQQTIDDILAKVSARGMQALTWSERRALKRATDRQRQRDVELSRND